MTNETFIVKGNVVSLDRIRMDNASIDHAAKYNYNLGYKWSREELPNNIDVAVFCKAEANNAQEVNALLNAVRCRKAMDLYVNMGGGSKFDADDTSLLDDYIDDTLLTFDYETGKNIFDEKAYEKDLNEYESKQKLLIDEHNRLVAQTTMANAVASAERIYAIKSKMAELKTAQPKKEDTKYNHPEIAKGETTVAEALNRYKELHALKCKYEKEWDDYKINVRHQGAKHLNISEDTFKVFKELYTTGVLSHEAVNSRTIVDALQYGSVEDFNENNWKSVHIDEHDVSRKFLNQKHLKLWDKYGQYIDQFYAPFVVDWLMYEHFTDKDLVWMNALKSFVNRVIAFKRITG